MCGLVGAFRAKDAHFTKIGDFMWQGLYMSALRGMGGTGCGLVLPEYDTEYAKTHASAIHFLGSAEWDWIDKNIYASHAVVGHTRSATTGGVKAVNSHPFRFKNDDSEIMMIHNGHVRNHLSLTPALFKHDVDSAHVAHSLLHRGAIETLELLEGAYTLIWYDKKKKTMNLARNEERELYFAQNKEKTTFYFASEIDFLSSLLRRNRIPHEDVFYTLKTHTLYEYDLTKGILAAKETQYEEKKAPPAASFPHYQNANGGPYANASDSWKNYTKPYAGVGDSIWCRIADETDVALTLYKEIGEPGITETTAYGCLYGTRPTEHASIIRINGINRAHWLADLHKIKACIPIKITKVERNCRNRHNGTLYTYYEGGLEHDEAAKEVRQANMRINRIRLDEKRFEDAKIAREAAAEAAGRTLPVVIEGSAAKLVSEQRVGAVGLGVDVGPPDRASEGADGDGNGAGLAGLEEKEAFIIEPTYYPGPKGRKWTASQWKECAQDGCYFCYGKFDIQTDAGKVEFWAHPKNPEDHKDTDTEYQMICPVCMDDPKKAEAIVAA